MVQKASHRKSNSPLIGFNFLCKFFRSSPFKHIIKRIKKTNPETLKYSNNFIIFDT